MAYLVVDITKAKRNFAGPCMYVCMYVDCPEITLVHRKPFMYPRS